MKELLQSIFASAKDRVTNVFAGTFAIAWIICNWEPISIFLFWDWDIVEKWFHLNLFYNNWVNLLLWPLVFTGVYLLLIPYINLGLAHVQTFFYVKTKNQVNKRNTLTIETEKELIKAKVQLEFFEAQERNISDHKKEIESLNEIIEGKNKMIETYQEQVESLNKTYTESQNNLKIHYELEIENLKQEYELRYQIILNKSLEYKEDALNSKLKQLAFHAVMNIEDVVYLKNSLIEFIDKNNLSLEDHNRIIIRFKEQGNLKFDIGVGVLNELLSILKEYHY